MMKSDISYPIRINRYLFLRGYCSRRSADRLIKSGDVLVNTKRAVLGQQITADDVVSFTKDGKTKTQAKKWYVILNKPTGVVSHNPQSGEISAADYLSDIPADVSPVGRLDKASHGLLLLSNDGMIVDALLNPKHHHQKVYRVTVDKRIDKHFITQMEAGVQIENYFTKPAKINKIDARTFEITLTEGKKHQIRRMSCCLGLPSARLDAHTNQHYLFRQVSPWKVPRTKYARTCRI